MGAGERRCTDAQRLPRVRAESRPASGGVWRGLSRSAHVAGLGDRGDRGAPGHRFQSIKGDLLRA